MSAIAVLSPSAQKNTFIQQSQVPEIVNKCFIGKFYSQPLPSRDKVTVPLRDDKGKVIKWVSWNNLSLDEKIALNNGASRARLKADSTEVYNKVEEGSVQRRTEEVAKKFFGDRDSTMAPRMAPIEGDPRETHGSDHACRASLFAPVFVYLYRKYHPTLNTTEQDVVESQIVAAGHDCARQTEGPDVYEEASADNTQKVYKELGINDQHILARASDAIIIKESAEGEQSVVAKALHSADSADFMRIFVELGWQYSSKQFENARAFLEIYKDFDALAKKGKLRNDLTFADFCKELDVLREEMNKLIQKTHQREFRVQAVASGDYYHAVLSCVNAKEHPNLHKVLTELRIK